MAGFLRAACWGFGIVVLLLAVWALSCGSGWISLSKMESVLSGPASIINAHSVSTGVTTNIHGTSILSSWCWVSPPWWALMWGDKDWHALCSLLLSHSHASVPEFLVSSLLILFLSDSDQPSKPFTIVGHNLRPFLPLYKVNNQLHCLRLLPIGGISPCYFPLESPWV